LACALLAGSCSQKVIGTVGEHNSASAETVHSSSNQTANTNTNTSNQGNSANNQMVVPAGTSVERQNTSSPAGGVFK
jgi:hypothetical protein